jgi:hypothetical protein
MDSLARHIRGLLSFGEGCIRLSICISRGAEYHVKKGDKVRFWHDSWRGGVPLKIQFKTIFEICNKPDALVKDFWKEGEWDIPLRRSMYGASLAEWNELMTVLHEV